MPSVVITCAATPFVVGGNGVGGLAVGDSVVLQDNGGNNLTVSANGAFAFTTPVASNQTYAVTVFQKPDGARLARGTSLRRARAPSRTRPSRPSASRARQELVHGPSGTLAGMDLTSAGNTITLQDNLGDNLPLNANGTFTFATSVLSGAAYSVTVSSQPPNPAQTCQVLSGTGTIGSANVTGVVVNCNTNVYSIGGNVSGLGAGDTVMLTDNGGDSLPVSANGSFTFDVPRQQREHLQRGSGHEPDSAHLADVRGDREHGHGHQCQRHERRHYLHDQQVCDRRHNQRPGRG